MRVRRTPSSSLAPSPLAVTVVLVAAPPGSPSRRPAAAVERQQSATSASSKRYPADTWRSFEAMAVPATGLPADNIGGDLDPASRSAFTSPTNIGAYLWSTVAARDTGLIGRREAQSADGADHRLDRPASSSHEPSGMFYNWYDPATGEKLRTFPESGDPIKPFLSTVDNGWLATGLLLAARAEPSLAEKADAIREDMNFGCYYNEAERPGRPDPRRLLGRGPAATAAAVTGDYCGMGHGRLVHRPPLRRLQHRAADRVVPRHRRRPDPGQALLRHVPDLPERQLRLGLDRDQAGRRVEDLRRRPGLRGRAALPRHEHRPDLGRQHVRGADGAAVRARGDVGPAVVGRQPPALRARPDRARAWTRPTTATGASRPSNNPAGGYREYGVDQLGTRTDAGLHVRPGAHRRGTSPTRAAAEGTPAPTAYGDGVVTPHASFLALRYAPRRRAGEPAQHPSGTSTPTAPAASTTPSRSGSGTVSKRYLSLDQGMVMAALGNALAGDDMRALRRPAARWSSSCGR